MPNFSDKIDLENFFQTLSFNALLFSRLPVTPAPQSLLQAGANVTEVNNIKIRSGINSRNVDDLRLM